MMANTVSRYLYGLTVNSQYLGITVWTVYCPLLGGRERERERKEREREREKERERERKGGAALNWLMVSTHTSHCLVSLLCFCGLWLPGIGTNAMPIVI